MLSLTPPAVAAPRPASTDSAAARAGQAQERLEAAELDRFWTTGRLRSAAPDGRISSRSSPDGVAPSTAVNAGVEMVGAFFWIDARGKVGYCAATVVESPHRNLIIGSETCMGTAGNRRRVAFVPGYQDGRKPWGLFPVKFEHSRATGDQGKGQARPRVAIAQVGPNTNGVQVQDAVGGVELVTDAPYQRRDVRFVGYQGQGPRRYECTGRTTGFTDAGPGRAASLLRLPCEGHPEASGGPLLVPGAKGQVGATGIAADWPGTGNDAAVYGIGFGREVRALYDRAVRIAGPRSSPAPAAPLPESSSPAPGSPSPKRQAPWLRSTPVPPTPRVEADPDPAALDAYWTPERMLNAQPTEDSRHVGRDTPPDPPLRRELMAPSKPFNGIPVVGTFFYTGRGNDHFCGGTVVKSQHRNIVISAGHCLDDGDAKKNLSFVPQYHDGQKPHGLFGIRPGRIYIDQRYYDKGHKAGADLDFAFVQLTARKDGKQVQDVVGGVDLVTNAPYDQPKVRLIGYPGDAPKPLDCTSNTSKFTSSDSKVPGSFLRIACDGYKAGTSGGPFLIPRPNNQLGVIGVIGGYYTGGKTPNVSFSSYFDNDVTKLFNAAVSSAPPAGRTLLGKAQTWQHAYSMASGYFVTDPASDDEYMDLIVQWDDGEVSLYRGAGERGNVFDKEIRLASPGSVWQHAREITGGDFTGGEAEDLIVRWKDGELTLYPDVDERGFHGEIQLQKPNDLWENAHAITAGRYATSSRRNDLIVRWSDGEVSLYADVSASGLGTEHMLLKPNDLWKHAHEIAAGDYTGNDNHDLMVRWSDGEATVYPDLTVNGFRGEYQLKAPNSTWTHAKVVTAGDYTENPWPDDLIIRWSDGEVSLHIDVDSKLHGERTLVAPPR
ncbi:hypothetical protein GCM10010411_44770 [Actinomadura fulvescens]|uniref:Peptidase S1 domain-containing protein n=1 Tax=Actinomadura fulvescens TaxID=46160 RepID=A0ABP6C998_9ACTN